MPRTSRTPKKKRTAAAKALAKKTGISLSEAITQVEMEAVVPMSQSSKSKNLKNDEDAGPALEYETTDTVLHLLKKHAGYMRKIVLRAGPMTAKLEDTLRCFEFQCLYGAMNGTP